MTLRHTTAERLGRRLGDGSHISIIGLEQTGKTKTLRDVTFAPGTAEGLGRVNWEGLGHCWSPGGSCARVLRAVTAVGSLGQVWVPPAHQVTSGVKSTEEDRGL